jgi:undecaprenyl-diphosphatase
LVLFEGRRNHRFIVFFLISFLTTGYLVSYVFKPVFHRIRPAYRTNIKHSTACPSDYSFPSGHAASAFAAAATLSAFHKKRKYFFYTVAGLISLSRIYFYCHFFVDVAIGAVFGYLVSKIILLIFKK